MPSIEQTHNLRTADPHSHRPRYNTIQTHIDTEHCALDVSSATTQRHDTITLHTHRSTTTVQHTHNKHCDPEPQSTGSVRTPPTAAGNKGRATGPQHTTAPSDARHKVTTASKRNAAPPSEAPALRARRLFRESGLADPLSQVQPDRFAAKPTQPQRELTAQLRTAVLEHCEDAADADRLATALEWFKEFRAHTGRVPFIDPQSPGGIEYNQETLEMFAEYIRKSGSRQKGREGATLRSDTIGAYVSAVKVATSRAQRQPITSPEKNIRLPLLYKQMRREQPPDASGDTSRALQRGIRARHLRKIADEGYDRSSRRGIERWAAAVIAHNLLLRGGEIGRTSKKAHDHTRDLTLASITFKDPCEESEWCPWLLVCVIAIKDTYARHKPMLIPVRRRNSFTTQPQIGADPLDAYDALLLAYRARAEEVATSDFARAPLFTGSDNVSAWSTDDTRELARSLGALAGFNPMEMGGKSFRIGGATDMREALGDNSQLLIMQRGRWATDIAQVYQRALVKSHLDASVALGSAQASRDLEELCKGWAQPAW